MERNFIMSTKEIAYTILDNLNEEQLKAFVALFKDYYPRPCLKNRINCSK